MQTTTPAAVVVGAGTMGHGIAQVLAMAGHPTTLIDLNADVLAAGRAKIEDALTVGVKKGKVSEADRQAALARLTTSTSMTALSSAQLFIEAIPEKMAWKKQLFADACRVLPPGALLASNTSSLSITELAAATDRPERVVGLHFFNPVHIMKLLEIVRSPLTSDATLEEAQALAMRLGKTAIVVNDAPGFATSRLGICLGNEAMRMLEEGVASAKDIDQAMKLGYGHPMGPLALSDLVGLDVRLAISESLYAELGTDGFRPPQLLKRLVKLGHLGKKAGRGFYVWTDGELSGENPAARRL